MAVVVLSPKKKKIPRMFIAIILKIQERGAQNWLFDAVQPCKGTQGEAGVALDQRLTHQGLKN